MWEVIVSVIVRRYVYMNMCLIMNGYRNRAVSNYKYKSTVNDNAEVHIKCSEIPTANLNAVCNSCVKIVCCSSQLIFTSLSLGQQHKKSRRQFFSYLYIYFVIFALNLLNTKRRLLYLKTQFVPRSKHFSSQL